MRKSTFTFFFLLSWTGLFAQRFGGTPPSVKWQQISTDTARIIFPEGLDSQAQRVASLVHFQASQASPVSLGEQLKKIDIVLQNQTTVANGYVGLGPYRSEFYLTPFSNNFDQGSLSWIDQLSIHEYRHVQQFNNFNNGISKLMGVLFGEEGYALATNASIPDWFFEGDAVYNETVISPQGRGRLLLFMNAYTSLWQAGKNYSWMKLRNGSLKDYVPNHYHLGYLLVNYGYEKYGPDFWNKVTKDASAFKGLLYPFQKAIKKYAGVDYRTFRTNALSHYKNLSSAVQLNPAASATGPGGSTINVFPLNKHVVTNYLFPYTISGDSLLYLKTSYRHRPAFYIKDGKGEHRLRIKDIAIDDQFSYRNGKIVYAAYENDIRWRWRDYSVIKLLDIQTGRQKTITHRSKYFTPDISASGNKIAAVEVGIDGESELHILDAATGNVGKKFSSHEVSLYTDPKFINEDSLVTAVRLKDGRMTLVLIDLEGGNTIRLVPPSFNVAGYPSVSNNIVYFTASYEGNNNIYAIKLGDRRIYKIADGTLGNYFVNALGPEPGEGAMGDKITWSAFTAEGYQLQQKASSSFLGEPISPAATETLAEVYPVSHADAVSSILSAKNPGRYFPVSKYRRGTRLINFHSWRPYYEDPLFTFSLYGENVLNTLQTEVYYLYNENEKTSAAGITAVYGKWFPYISIGSQMTFARQDSVGSFLRQWNQLDSRIGLSVPLSFTRGRMHNSLNIGTNYVLRNEFNTGPNKNLTGTNDFTYLHHFISWSQQVESARQHIFPRLGYSAGVNHRYAVTKIDGYQFLASGALYLPGFLATHSLVLTGALQQRDTLRALFSSAIANARGHSDYYRTNAGSRMWRLSANYHFPLLYPDWGFGNILFLQRFRGNLFYDFQKLYSDDKQKTVDLRSAGAEFYVDTKWWNQYELTFGFRVSRLLDNDSFSGSTVFEFILPVSIFPR
ncbi:MAG: TolB family protein [Chitinophagaceae bacterium]